MRWADRASAVSPESWARACSCHGAALDSPCRVQVSVALWDAALDADAEGGIGGALLGADATDLGREVVRKT